jgi:CBS domain-containing protein
MVNVGVLRVVVSSGGSHALHLAGVISHSDALRVVWSRLGGLGPALAAAPVGALFPLGHPPLALPSTTSLRACFQQLTEACVAGCALVGDDGAIVGNLSTSDVRGLSEVVLRHPGDLEAVLDAPVAAYLGRAGAGPRAPVTVTPGDTLGGLLQLLCLSGVHQVHVVNAARVPVGVVTALDVLRALLCAQVEVVEVSPAAGGRTFASASCPFLGPALRALSAVEFASSMGKLVKDLVEVSATAPITAAVRALATAGVSAVPVFVERPVAEMPPVLGPVVFPLFRRQYCGWLDYADLAGVVLARSVSRRSDASLLSGVASALGADEEHFAMSALNFSGRDLMCVCPPPPSSAGPAP